MKHRLLTLLLATFALVGCEQIRDEIIVDNKSDLARVGEIVEVDAARFGIEEGKNFVVRNEADQIVPSQLTHDGKLIFACDLKASATAHYTVVKEDLQMKMKTYACGRVYPERVDDMAWESDLIAFRAYGPALQKSGERAFGYDVWVKNNTDLPVVEERYNKELNPETKAHIAELRKTDSAAADELAAAVSYHNDHGNGMDAYKVGPTLGGGATAIIDGRRIIYPYCWAECEILDNGPLRFTARLTYNPTVVDGVELTEVRTISIDKGSFLNKTTVVYNADVEKDVDVMSGIVLHEKQPRTTYCAEDNYVTYAEAVEAPDGGELYLAMLFPKAWDGAENRLWKLFDEKPAGTYGHAAVYNKVRTGEELTYYWGALWNKSTLVNVPDKEAFDKVMVDVAAARKCPLEVTTIVYERN